jgi:dihydrodipicolinate synthase/N-acetylneuraminate lyase
MNVLEEWIADACAALDLPALTTDERQAVLDLARDVAHGVVRPAAPVTAFLLGLAVGRGADLASATTTLTAMAKAREAEPRDSGAI